jgi:riboflavin synthase alpha subunit
VDVSEDAVHRAQRWQMFYEEDGGLREVMQTLRQAYFDRAADLMPNDTAQLLKLGMAAKIVDQIDGHVVHIINAGKIQQAAQDHADRIARLPEARRRFL